MLIPQWASTKPGFPRYLKLSSCKGCGICSWEWEYLVLPFLWHQGPRTKCWQICTLTHIYKGSIFSWSERMYEAVHWAMYVPFPKNAKLKKKKRVLAEIGLPAFIWSQWKRLIQKIGPTSNSTKKGQYIVLEVGNPFTFLSMVKSQTSCHINQNQFNSSTLLISDL